VSIHSWPSPGVAPGHGESEGHAEVVEVDLRDVGEDLDAGLVPHADQQVRGVQVVGDVPDVGGVGEHLLEAVADAVEAGRPAQGADRGPRHDQDPVSW
jgi:hypothetical protein